MRIKHAVTFLLGAFVVVALAMVMKDSAQELPTQPPIVEAAIAAADLTPAGPVEIETPAPGTAEPAAPEPAAAESEVRVAVAEAVQPVKAPPPAAVDAKAVESPKSVVAAQARPEVRKVVATYFHGNVRCATCRKVETYAQEAVEQGFQAEIEAGAVEFRAVNVEEPENRHFIQDYQLMTRSVVVTQEIDGAVSQWTRLDQVWTFVGNRPAYLNYVQDAVRGYLELH
jgi:hypothetical protein